MNHTRLGLGLRQALFLTLQMSERPAKEEGTRSSFVPAAKEDDDSLPAQGGA